MNKLIISLAAAILSLPVAADEGMWLLPLLKGQRFPEMQALGGIPERREVCNADYRGGKVSRLSVCVGRLQSRHVL